VSCRQIVDKWNKARRPGRDVGALEWSRRSTSGRRVFLERMMDGVAGMTERNIQRALYWRHRGGCQIMLPNYTPFVWQECDLFIVLKSGYSIEYEIKLSAADFRADFRKSKHDVLRNPVATRFVPTRFFYAVPEGLVSVDDIPEYAGLVYCRSLKNRPAGPLRIDVAREAPRLGKVKVNDRIVTHMKGAAYYRFWNERFRYEDHVRATKQVAVFAG